ncbi:hypothetical protein BS50DRAFT_164933 [Corynespora cassiicola Philippines]|uniref:Uncharacterized protein n=1 Tax=Corynespora cassiicola Philippines TaxID=1448308 RepID=A0A2T2N6L8_CORCC|nr:hypothetical protein BS50DRAFT_164933 [Corynespora cassiicola Philippines]
MLPRSIRPYIRLNERPVSLRTFYSKSAIFVTLDAQGQLSKREIDVRVGDENEAYVLVPTDVGKAIKSACMHNGSPIDTESLTWHHERRDFTCKSAPYLKLSVPHDLPRQHHSETSPATLYLFGESHTIALDGTPDSIFTEQLRGSLRTLKPALDNLKDM